MQGGKYVVQKRETKAINKLCVREILSLSFVSGAYFFEFRGRNLVCFGIAYNFDWQIRAGSMEGTHAHCVFHACSCAPERLVWSFFCCCVVPVSCFVTVLFDSCVAVQSCRGKSHMSVFFVCSCHICGNTVVLRSRNFATMATWHNGLSSLPTFSWI